MVVRWLYDASQIAKLFCEKKVLKNEKGREIEETTSEASNSKACQFFIVQAQND